MFSRLHPIFNLITKKHNSSNSNNGQASTNLVTRQSLTFPYNKDMNSGLKSIFHNSPIPISTTNRAAPGRDSNTLQTLGGHLSPFVINQMKNNMFGISNTILPSTSNTTILQNAGTISVSPTTLSPTKLGHPVGLGSALPPKPSLPLLPPHSSYLLYQILPAFIVSLAYFKTYTDINPVVLLESMGVDFIRISEILGLIDTSYVNVNRGGAIPDSVQECIANFVQQSGGIGCGQSDVPESSIGNSGQSDVPESSIGNSGQSDVPESSISNQSRGSHQRLLSIVAGVAVGAIILIKSSNIMQ